MRSEWDDQWRIFCERYADTGKPLIVEDFTKAHFVWAVMDFDQRNAAVKGMQERVDAGQWGDANYIPKPEKYLREDYRRPVIRRTSGRRTGNSAAELAAL